MSVAIAGADNSLKRQKLYARSAFQLSLGLDLSEPGRGRHTDIDATGLFPRIQE
jgi:hypothetical protein